MVRGTHFGLVKYHHALSRRQADPRPRASAASSGSEPFSTKKYFREAACSVRLSFRLRQESGVEDTAGCSGAQCACGRGPPRRLHKG